MHVQLGGVDHLVGDRDQRPQQLALEHDGIVQGESVVGQRVAPARVREALEQHLVAGVEEQELVGEPLVRDARQHRRQLLQVVLAVAHVDAHRKPRVMAVGTHRVDEGRQQGRRQVVDAVVVEVFQRAQRDGLAGAGQAADQDQALARLARSTRRGRRCEVQRRVYHGEVLRIWWAWRSMKVCAGSMPLLLSR